jgi:hypothetical protein
MAVAGRSSDAMRPATIDASAATTTSRSFVDDASRYAVVVPVADDRGESASWALELAAARFAEVGIRIERILTDNGSAYRSHAYRDALSHHEIRHKQTRPTGRRPTARPNASSRPCSTSGPTPGPIAPTATAFMPFAVSSISTIMDVRSPRSEALCPKRLSRTSSVTTSRAQRVHVGALHRLDGGSSGRLAHRRSLDAPVGRGAACPPSNRPDPRRRSIPPGPDRNSVSRAGRTRDGAPTGRRDSRSCRARRRRAASTTSTNRRPARPSSRDRAWGPAGRSAGGCPRFRR